MCVFFLLVWCFSSGFFFSHEVKNLIKYKMMAGAGAGAGARIGAGAGAGVWSGSLELQAKILLFSNPSI